MKPVRPPSLRGGESNSPKPGKERFNTGWEESPGVLVTARACLSKQRCLPDVALGGAASLPGACVGAGGAALAGVESVAAVWDAVAPPTGGVL